MFIIIIIIVLEYDIKSIKTAGRNWAKIYLVIITTYSKTGCPLTVQQQANDPIRIIMDPVPIRTYGAVSLNSVLISIYLYSSTSIQIPIPSIIIPETC